MARPPVDSDVELEINLHTQVHGGELDALVAWFGKSLEGVQGLDKLGNGHINSTWLVSTTNGDFVLQQLSREVFAAPEKLMTNLSALLAVVDASESFGYELPRPLPSAAGELLVTGVDDENLSYWRLSRYVAHARALETLSSQAEARAAGQAFGDFQATARALQPELLEPVIEGFLELEGYWASLIDSIDRNSGAREKPWEPLWRELKLRVDRYRVSGAGDTAVIHGDCKVNNLLFAENTSQVVAILDLDTLMSGPWWLDFGDLVRSAAFDSDGQFRLSFYAGVAEGFFAGRGGLEAAELNDALHAPGHLSFMLAVRFLDDHLRGDKYFRVEARGDNLVRARSQFLQLCKLESVDCFAGMESSLRDCLLS